MGFTTLPGKGKILCDNGRGGKGGGWQSKRKLRRISVFYDLGSFPQLRSTTTHFPSEKINIFNTQTQAKEIDRLYSTEVKNGPSTKNLETYLYFGEQTKAAVIPLHCGGEIPNQKLNQSTNKLFDQVNDSFKKKINIFCTLFYLLMCFFWKTCTFTKTLCSAHVLCLHFTWAQHSGFQGPRYRLLASKALSMH